VLGGRLVVPEVRAGYAVWLVGRLMSGAEDEPKYLGLAGDKPLLGWDWATTAPWPLAPAVPPGVLIVEGPFDWLTLVQWGLPAVALVGTYVRRAVLQELRQFERLYVLLDDDEAGSTAAAVLCAALGPTAVPASLAGPPGAKDVSDLATRLEGREVVVGTLARAWRHRQQVVPLDRRPSLAGAEDAWGEDTIAMRASAVTIAGTGERNAAA
jgi:hypothetical protein